MSLARRLWTQAWLVLLLSGCVEDARSRVGASQAAIANGEPDATRTSVGVLVPSQGSQCSATLIAPDTLLTAAHCVQTPATAFELDTESFVVTEVIPHPLFGVPGELDNDLAFVVLDHDSLQTPSTLELRPPVLDGEVVLVGNGDSGDGRVGDRTSGSARITRRTTRTFETDASATSASACAGDSGGAVFADDGLVGVISSGGSKCGEPATHTRIDTYAPWIAALVPDARTILGAQLSTTDRPPRLTPRTTEPNATVEVESQLEVAIDDDYGALVLSVFDDRELLQEVAVDRRVVKTELVLSPGKHTLTLRAEDASGNVGTAELDVEVAPPYAADGGDGSGCGVARVGASVRRVSPWFWAAFLLILVRERKARTAHRHAPRP